MVNRENHSIIFEKQFRIFLAAGIIWGLLELLLHLLFEAVVPTFMPLLLPFLILLFILTIKYFLPTPGAFLLMGIIAATIQYVLSGQVFPNSLIIILVESLIVEIVFLLLRYRTVPFLLSAVLISLYNMFHPYVISGYLYEHVQFVRFKSWFAGLLGYATTNAIPRELVTTILIILHLLSGLLAAWLALKIIGRLKEKGYFERMQVLASL